MIQVDDDQDIDQVTNALAEWFQDAERELDIPHEWIVTFGKWEQLKRFMEEVVYEYGETLERWEKSMDEVKELKDAIVDMKIDIQKIVRDLETMPDIDEIADAAIIQCIKKLDQIVSNGEIEPIKKKKKK